VALGQLTQRVNKLDCVVVVVVIIIIIIIIIIIMFDAYHQYIVIEIPFGLHNPHSMPQNKHSQRKRYSRQYVNFTLQVLDLAIPWNTNSKQIFS
jgi:hypothetical protein